MKLYNKKEAKSMSGYVPVVDNVLKNFSNIKVENVDLSGNSYVYSFSLNNIKVKLNCPKTYPKDCGCFYLESDKQYSWIHSINSSILDSIDEEPEQQVFNILKKLCSDYTSVDESKDNFFENEDIYGDYDDLYMGFQDDNEVIFLMRQKKKWEKKDKELRAKHQSKLTKYQLESVNQIFSKGAAYQVLVNDLTKVMKNKNQIGIQVIPVDDNVYHWKIHMFDFGGDNKLTKQLAELEKEHGYNYVELEFKFEMNLYPFYPPQVKLNKPRLENFMMERIATLDMLKFSNWNSTNSMTKIVEVIKDLIGKYGMIDVKNPRNSISGDAYLDIEYKLLNLSLLTEVDPRVNNEFIAKNKEKVVPKKIKPKSKGKDGKYWKSGVGFGFSGRNDWDINSYVAAEKEKDNNIYMILQDVWKCLQKKKKDKYFAKIIEYSALIPVMESYLIGSTMLEMSKHLDLFIMIMNIIRDMTHEDFIYLCDRLPNQDKSLYEILEPMSSEAIVFLDTVAKSGSEESFLSEEQQEINLTQTVLDVFYVLKKNISTHHSKLEQKDEENKMKEMKDKPLEEKYKQALAPFQYDSMKIDDSLSKFRKMDAGSTRLSRKGIMRVGKELCVFQKSLPLSFSSTVFMRTDDSKSHIMQFIITGPEDTPYSNGCFLFDLVIPSNFPDCPPKCLLETTGGGSVRFNPNLYNCGKVCLSLLGTWLGSAGEKWNKNTSTLLQLLVSIQSLILVPNPYFNEPGYESEMHSEHGKQQNRSYNENIRYQNMQWAILDQIKNPSPGFEDAIKTHFLLKKDKVLEECSKWVDECFDKNKSNYKSMYNSIKNELEKLENSYSIPTHV